MNNKDLRVIKSKKNIRNAFIELMHEKGYHNITVTDIAQKALINRKTFYFHYETKDDLYNEIADEITSIIKPEEILSNIESASKEDQNKVISHFLMELKTHKDVCKVFLNDESNPGFADRIKQKLADALLSKPEITARIADTGYTADLLINVYMAVFQIILRWWINTDNTDPQIAIKYMTDFFSKQSLELLGIKY